MGVVDDEDEAEGVIEPLIVTVLEGDADELAVDVTLRELVCEPL